MKSKITFKNSVIILWIATLILIFSLFRFKYFSFGMDNEFILRVDRITGKIEVMNRNHE